MDDDHWTSHFSCTRPSPFPPSSSPIQIRTYSSVKQQVLYLKLFIPFFQKVNRYSFSKMVIFFNSITIYCFSLFSSGLIFNHYSLKFFSSVNFINSYNQSLWHSMGFYHLLSNFFYLFYLIDLICLQFGVLLCFTLSFHKQMLFDIPVFFCYF